jgi:hypothetical protein
MRFAGVARRDRFVANCDRCGQPADQLAEHYAEQHAERHAEQHARTNTLAIDLSG